MKVLFLSLLLGAVWEFCCQLSGQWRTVYIASSNLEKIKPNGQLLLKAMGLLANIYISRFFITAPKYISNFTGVVYMHLSLSLTDEGKNVFEVTHASGNILVAHNINVDEHGKKTALTGLFGTYDNLLLTDFERFKEETRDKGIPEENIVNFIDNGNEIIFFPEYRSPVNCKYVKYVNIIKKSTYLK
uniref:Lipocalin/cytosolic fatty-acid binding domain-containing protein n=1 Tax=Moschus moschiferus TaxID=68415 RepID=A0A8C6E8B9_MOSMO